MSNVARRSISSPVAGCGSNGPIHVGPGPTMWITPGATHVTGRERHAPDHARHVLGDHLLVADSVLDAADRGVGEDRRRGRDRRLGRGPLDGDDADLALGDLGRIRTGLHSRGELGVSGDAEPVGVDRGDVLGGRIERPHLDVRELREVGSEQTADRAGADDADSLRHRYEFTAAAAISSQTAASGPATPRPARRLGRRRVPARHL